MALYLVQHGKASPPEVDPERGLSEEGRAEVERIAEMAKHHGIHVHKIQHSGKKRAEQTAAIFATALKPEGGIEQRDGIAPLDDVIPIARTMKGKDSLMLVGHLPFMERLASQLIIGNPDRPVVKFQNGAIVCLEEDAPTQTWVIKWTLVPTLI